MRPSILPNLLEAAARNATRGFTDVALFEIGPVFTSARPDGGATVAGGVRSGAHGPRHWNGAHHSRGADVFDAKADALNVLDACGIPTAGLQLAREAPPWFHPGQSGVLRQGKKVLAHFGALHPALLADFKLTGPVAGFEVFLGNLSSGKKRDGAARKLLQIANLQSLSRDFAFLVGETVAAEDIVQAARAVDKDMIISAEIFDIYTGQGIAPGQKSVALNVMIQPREKTLTEAELSGLAQKVVAGVAAKTGAVLRN